MQPRGDPNQSRFERRDRSCPVFKGFSRHDTAELYSGSLLINRPTDLTLHACFAILTGGVSLRGSND